MTVRNGRAHAEVTPERLLELAAGQHAARVLFAFLDLGLPRRLARGPATVAALASELGLHPLAADRFVHACVALGLLRRDGERVRNDDAVAAFLAGGADTTGAGRDLTAALLARRRVDPGWDRLVDRLREWTPPRGSVDSGPADDDALSALAAQHGLSLAVGDALARAHDFGAHRRLLDLGAGTAAMTIAICARHPRLRAVALDRPRPAELASERVAAAGLGDRIEVVAGDLLADPWPAADVVLLANVLSTAGEEVERALLARVARHLPPGGIAIVSGWILDDAGDRPLVPVLFCLEDIVGGAPDVERTARTYAAWLAEAGFAQVSRLHFLAPWSAMVARR